MDEMRAPPGRPPRPSLRRQEIWDEEEPRWVSRLRGEIKELREATRDNERALLVLTSDMKFIVDEMKEQRTFRQRAYWLGLSVIGLLVLDALGFDVSLIK